MKNILNEKPKHYENLSGRCRYCCDWVLVENIENKKVLEIGCGLGWFALNCVEKNIGHYVGIEHQKHNLIAAKKNISDSHIEFHEASALELPYPDQSFDTIVIFDVIEHLPIDNELPLFNEMFRVLKEGGKIFLSTPYASMISKFADPAYWLIGHRHYSIQKLLQFGSNAGLLTKSVQIKGRVYELVALFNLYISKWIFRRSPFFEYIIEKKLNEEYKGNGYMTIFIEYQKIYN